jgi:hypothetical protein
MAGGLILNANRVDMLGMSYNTVIGEVFWNTVLHLEIGVLVLHFGRLIW